MDYIGILLHAFRCAVIPDKHLDVKVNHATFPHGVGYFKIKAKGGNYFCIYGF